MGLGPPCRFTRPIRLSLLHYVAIYAPDICVCVIVCLCEYGGVRILMVSAKVTLSFLSLRPIDGRFYVT